MANWEQFYKATEGEPPQPLLVKAVEFCMNKSEALDLGAGTLRDTKFLLEQGFDVIAVDSSPLMLEIAEKIHDERFHAIQSDFDQYNFPQNEFDLVNAQWALPFNDPETFDAMFGKLTISLKKDGIFAGQFFGKNDEWNTQGTKMAFHDKEGLERLIKDFKVIELQEEDQDGNTAVGNVKHWHVFHVIARKI